MAARALRRDHPAALPRNLARSARCHTRLHRFVLRVAVTVEAAIQVWQQEILGSC